MEAMPGWVFIVVMLMFVAAERYSKL